MPRDDGAFRRGSQPIDAEPALTDEHAMALALREARAAAAAGEVPVGAVVLRHGRVIGRGRNAPIARHDPTAHAEIMALRAAAEHLGNYRLDGCTLVVTLEPCAMCVGAALQARVSRVVFGAAEPKSGAAGSVVDLFAERRLNSHATCSGGVLGAESLALLRAFFRQKRSAQRASAADVRLREDALRTPALAFDALSDPPARSDRIADLPALDGLQFHYVDEGPLQAPLTWLCLHDLHGWSHQWRRHAAVWRAAGHRVLAVDLIGFGRSDKPKRRAAHAFDWHVDVLRQWVERLDLRRVVLVLPSTPPRLGLQLLRHEPLRFCGVLVSDPGWTATDAGARSAPFPDAGHRAGPTRFAQADFHSAGNPAALRAFWQDGWPGRTMVACGAQPFLYERDAVDAVMAMVTQGSEPAGEPPAAPPSAQAVAEAAVGYFSP